MEGHLEQVLGLLYCARKPPKQNVSVLSGKRSWLQLLRDNFSSSWGHLLQVWALPHRCGAISNGTYCHSSSCCSTSDSSMSTAFHLAMQAEACLILSIKAEVFLYPVKIILSLLTTVSSLCLMWRGVMLMCVSTNYVQTGLCCWVLPCCRALGQG